MGNEIARAIEYLSSRLELAVTIEDTGIGMTSQQLTRIFEPFAQADTSTTREYGGTGLGLSISQQLAEALGGTLDVHSRPGEGTTVVLTLALNCPSNTRILSPEEATAGLVPTRCEEFEKVDLSGIRVLIVDDGDTNRDLLTLLLNDSGAEVMAATNGQQALDILIDQKQDADVVLMDMQMPVMDGYTATKELRRLGFTRPIVAMTANAMTGDDAKCRQAGCSEYLSKPIDLHRLLEMIADCSSGSPSNAATQRTSTQKAGDEMAVVEAASLDSKPEPTIHDSATSHNNDDSILPNDWLREFACDMIDRVAETLPMMQQACDAREWDKIARQVHWIKGTGGTVGLDKLSELAGECELAVHDSEVDDILSTIEEMRLFVAQAQRERSSDASQSEPDNQESLD